MTSLRKINKKAITQDNTGFGSNSTLNAGRFVNKDGKANIKKIGIPYLQRYSIYHSLIEFSRWKFTITILGFFILVNIAFASLYFVIGIDQMEGITSGTSLENFGQAFFFSAQTFTTVGYGRISPSGFLTSTVAAIEALTGLLSFAVVTGLFYGRFSRPRAYLKFSHNMVVAPFKKTTALMFRMVPYKNNQLTDIEVKVTFAMSVDDEGEKINKFYQINLEISKVNTLNLNWTVVHVIDETSPLYGFKLEDMKAAGLQVLILVRGFDEAFSNTVIARSSYTSSEILYGARFNPMYEANQNGTSTLLYIDRLNDTEKAELPLTIIKESQNSA